MSEIKTPRQLFELMSQAGWKEEYKQYVDLLEYGGAGEQIAQALIKFWHKEPTLRNFAKQLNGASTLDIAQERIALIATLNSEYIRLAKPPKSIKECYDELRFWNGCDMPDAQQHFERVARRFVLMESQSDSTGNEANAILKAKHLSPQMEEVRSKLLSAIITRKEENSALPKNNEQPVVRESPKRESKPSNLRTIVIIVLSAVALVLLFFIGKLFVNTDVSTTKPTKQPVDQVEQTPDQGSQEQTPADQTPEPVPADQALGEEVPADQTNEGDLLGENTPQGDVIEDIPAEPNF